MPCSTLPEKIASLVQMPRFPVYYPMIRSCLLLMLGWSCLTLPALRSAEWLPIAVPGTWEEKGPVAARNYDGVVWYRTWVQIPDNFFVRHARNIWAESVNVNISDLADAHEVYVNGVKIGAGGQFPPNFKSGLAEIHRHQVPVGNLQKSVWNEIALRVYSQSGAGGFRGEAPFLVNYSLECVLAGRWEILLGDDYRPGAALAERPVTSSFDQFRESKRLLGRSAQFVTGPKLSPQESHAKMTTAEDLQVDLLLHEPLVAQPTHLSFDERGRMWVSQYRQYPYPAGLKMVGRLAGYESVYDRVPPAPPNHDRGADVISIHEDTDGDGIYDRHKVFQDGLNMANSAVRGRGGIWVINAPYLLFYPDRNFDDVPDGPPEVRLQGFGLEDTHAVANGLVWGPDGWLYGGQGSTSSSRITRPGVDAPDAPGVFFHGCMVWRYHPETKEYDIFSRGGGNVFGLEFDGDGRIYSGTNGGKSRGFHYVQGGFYFVQKVNPRDVYAFGELPKMNTLTSVPRFSHFGALVEGTALPARYRRHLFSIDPLHNEIIDVERRATASTFETRDLPGRPLKSTDGAFRPVYIVNAPDGSLCVADFYEYYIAHGQHYLSQIDPSTGRVYRLRGKGAALERDINLERKSTDELIALLAHPNKWHRQTAVRLLGERQDRSAAGKLQEAFARNREVGALNALWALAQLNVLDDATTRAALHHDYAPVRMWAVRLLGDKYGLNRGLGLPPTGVAKNTEVPEDFLKLLSELARHEPDAEVRSQIASTACRLTTQQALALVADLSTREVDTADPYIPLLNWWTLEAHLRVAPAAVLNWAKTPALWDRPMVQQHLLPRLMRRFAADGRPEDLLVCAQLLRWAPEPRHAALLMKGFEEAYRGREVTGLPEELMQAMAASGQVPLILRVRQGNEAALQAALQTVRDKQAKAEERLLYIRVFGEVRQPSAVSALLEVASGVESSALRKAALVALMSYEQTDIGPAMAALLPRVTEDLRVPILALLASRASWSGHLLDAMDQGTLAAATVPPDVVSRLRTHDDPSIATRVARRFPVVATGDAATFQRRIAEVEAKLKLGAGSPFAGEPLFAQSCASCHKLYDKGGNIGPDLTNYQRDNLGTMLPSIIYPNAEIREGFEYHSVVTQDGRSLSGFLVSRTPQVVVLRGLEGEDITLRQSEIKNLQPMGRSLMPDGLLDHLNDQQLRDLFAYLRTKGPL